MKKPIYYRRFDYDKALIPNKYLASLEEGVSTIEQANEKTGFTIGYPGWNLVYDMVISHLHPDEYNIIIETGTNVGCTTIILAQALKDSGCNGKVYTVELDKKNYQNALANLEKSGVADFVEAVNAHSHDFLKDFVKTNSSVRIAFLDASHLFKDVIGEFELILPLLGPHSIVIFDNTYLIAEEHEDQRVNGALREITKRHGGNLINFETVSWYTPGLAVWQKSPFDCTAHTPDKSTIINGAQNQHKDWIIGMFSQAHNLAIGGDYAKALELYDKIIAEVPTLILKTPQINYERALCLKALDRVHEAEQAIRSSLCVKPDDPKYLQFLSEILFATTSNINPSRESKLKSESANIKQADQVDLLCAEVKTLLPLVEEADVKLALKAISLIEKRIIGRLCGKLGDKILQYLSIVQFVRSTSSKTVDSIEIGTLFGGSCLTKLFAMRDLGVVGKVICIDPMSGYYGQPLDPDTGIAITADVFFENIARFGFPKESVELREVKSNDLRAVEGLKEQFYATLMVDGDHSYNGVRYDWENYNRFVCDKGIILFDDYTNRAWPDINIFVTELKDCLPRGWKELGCLGTTLLLQRTAKANESDEDCVDKEKIYEGLNKCYFSQQCHEKEVIENLPELLDGVKVFVDIGASLGQYTFHASKYMQEGEIIAIEADPVRFEELERNCRKWRLSSNNKLSALFAAVCDKQGQETFYITNSGKSGGLFKRDLGSEPVNWAQTVIKCVTLDKLFKDMSPDLVKIDVEGAELRVLKGATRILSEGKTRFLIEVHSGVDPEGQKEPSEVFKLMESFGYKTINFHGRNLFFNNATIKENVYRNGTDKKDITTKEFRENLRTKIIDMGLETVSTRSASNRLNALEVGCMFRKNEGFSTFQIAHFMQQLRGEKRFISIDCDSEHIDACKQMLSNFEPTLLSDVKFLCGHSLEMLPKALDEIQSVDFALLDGGAGPECCLREFELIAQSLSENGLVVIDDLQDMAPTEAYPFPRMFGKGTLILPFMVIAEYMKACDILCSNKSNIQTNPTKQSGSELIAQTSFSGLLKLLENLGYLIISKNSHRMMVVGQCSILESFRCQLEAKRLPSIEIAPTGMFVDAPSSINLNNSLKNTFTNNKSLSFGKTIKPPEDVPSVTLRNIEIFANKYIGRRAFIIGNGPSLNRMDLTKLKNEITFGVNNIFYLFSRMGFKPTFYVVEDKLVAEDRTGEINALTGMTKIFGTELQYCLEHSEDVVWTNVIYDFSNYPDFPHFSEDASQCLWVGGTVSYLCMQLAYYMGFSEVYLVGFDHNYVIPANANVDGTTITSLSNDPNHFHPEYFGKGKRWHDPRLDRMEKAYVRAKEVFKAHGRKIFNATVGGKLEIFPRVNYESLFAGNEKETDRRNNPANIAYSKDSAIAVECNNKVKQIQNHPTDKIITTPKNPRFSHLVLDYTRVCNSRCTYCGIWKMKDGPELSLETIERLFFSISSFGLSTCYVTGGEPYISDKIVDIARLLHKYLPKCRLSGATNSIQPTQILQRIQKILNIGVPLEVHVSINGSEATHDATRGGPGFWKKAVYLLETLKSAGVPVVASMSLMPQTLADLPYMQEFCAQRDIRLMFSWVRQWERYGSVDKQYSTWSENIKTRLKEIEYLPDTFDCPGLSKRLVVTPDGSVYPCEVYHPEILLGNVNRESLEYMLNSPRADAMTQMICNKNCHWCQDEGEYEGSPKWMLMDCYRRHSKQYAYMTERFPQVVNMSPQESRLIIENIISNKSVHQIPVSIKNENVQTNRISKSKVRISAIICTHRNPELLNSTIKSLLNQTLQRDLFEIIVVDNNSQDRTQQVVQSYDGVRYVQAEKLGLSYARNSGIQIAEGEIIAFIDDDAEASPGWLEALLKIYEAIPDAWAVGGKVLPIWDAPKQDWITEDKLRQLSLVSWGNIPRPLRWPERIIGTNCSFRRQVFSDIGFFDAGLGRIGTVLLGNEDTEIQQRIHALGRLVYYTPEAVVYHHVPAYRMTKEYFKRRSEGTILSQNIMSLRSQGKDQEIEKINAEIRRKLELSDLAQKQQQVLNESNKLLSQYKDRYRGQRCIIIGNGPSLNKMDLSFLKNEITFGMNRIYLLFDKWNFKPTYYVSVNPLVIEQSVEKIREINAPRFLSLEGLPFIGTAKENIFIQRRPGSAHFSDDPRNGCWWPTVTYAAMQLAYFMGFSEVFLIGVDHYFKTRGDSNKEIVSDGVDQDHFHPDYFGKGIRWNLPDLERSEVAYRLAKQAYEAAGRLIIDATVDGHLTIFPKVDYKQVFLPTLLTSNSDELCFNATLIDTEFGEYVRDRNEKSKITARPKIEPSVSAEPHREYLVSAIVSTYNSERFLRGCLDDLEQQTIADKLEIIVVNSGSQENEEAIVHEYQQRYNNIIYIKTEQREGIYSAWNRAVKIARGDFLTNANTDDRHREDALEKMAQTLLVDPDIALVYGDQICTDTPNGTFASHHVNEMAKRPEYSRQRLLFGCCVGSQPMWRKSLHDEMGYFDESLDCAGDWDFWLRISNKYRFKHIPDFLGLYYYNKEGIEHGRKIHSLYERYIVGKRYGNPYISVIPQYKSKDSPLVSVITPAYNTAKYIAEAIESVLIQSYRNFELVIINDGSTDGTEEIIHSFKDNKIRYSRQENRGLAATHNAGIRQSRGQFIIKLDADDKMTPDFISRHLQEFEKHPEADLVYCDDYLMDQDDKPIRIIKRPEYTDRRLLIRDLFRCGYPIVPFRTCIRRSVFDKIGFFEENLPIGEDYDMMRRFVKHGLKISHLPSALYLRRMTENSLSRDLTPQKAKCQFELVKRFIETFKHDELFPDVEWDSMPADKIQLNAKCLAVKTYLAIGQDYLNTHSAGFYAKIAFERACSELRDCLKIDPGNRQIRELLQKCELGRQRYEKHSRQLVC